MFDWARKLIAQFEPLAVEYVENLLAVGIAFALLAGIFASAYYLITTWGKKDDPAMNDGIVILKIANKASAAFTLPVAPALGLSAIYPNLLGKIEGIQPAMVIAAFTLFWASIKAFKD